MTMNLYELATDGYTTDADGGGGSSFDLTDAHTPQAWPIMSMSYLLLDKSGAISTCANKSLLLEFLLFLYSSPVVRSLGDEMGVGAFAPVYVERPSTFSTVCQPI